MLLATCTNTITLPWLLPNAVTTKLVSHRLAERVLQCTFNKQVLACRVQYGQL